MTTPPSLPVVSILATGGTIAGKARVEGSLANYASGVILGETLLEAVPELHSVADVRPRQIANIGSEDMVPEVWSDLARALAENEADPGIDGTVILHGTDTMEETAFFLHLAHGGRKPVVMTGAMRPADAPSADGPMNILNAVRIVRSPAARDRGVLVAMNDRIHRAVEVMKTDTINLDAFSSRNGGGEGRMVDGEVVFHRPAFAGPSPVASPALPLDLPRVEIIYGHAGQGRALVDAALAAGAWGIVHAGVGMGNIHRDVRPALAEAAAGGTAVVCASRVAFGPVPVTESGRHDRFIAAGGLSPQKARILLQLALAEGADHGTIQTMFDRFR